VIAPQLTHIETLAAWFSSMMDGCRHIARWLGEFYGSLTALAAHEMGLSGAIAVPAAVLVGVTLLLGLARVAQRTAWMLILSGWVLIAIHTIVLLAGRLAHS
jgi:hypothetical protein